MSFSTGDIILFFIALFFIYATPVIYVLLTIHGALKKHENKVLIKAIVFANLIIVANIIYYADVFHGDSELQFISISLMIFSPASFFLLVKTKNKISFYIYIIIFSLSLCAYNIYHFPSKLEMYRDEMIITSFKQGDIKKLQNLFDGGCPAESNSLDYLRRLTGIEKHPVKSFDFLLVCIDKNPLHRFSGDNFITYYKDTLKTPNINTSLLNLLVYDYYHYLNDEDKQAIVESLLNEISYDHSDEKKQAVERLNYLIQKRPELKVYIKIDDDYLLRMIGDGNAIFIDYIKPFYSTRNESMLLAMSVLLQHDEEVIRKVEYNGGILRTKILNSVGGIWGDRDVDLLSYIFRYGSGELIDWLITNYLDSIDGFDYQHELFNHETQKDEYYCENYLLKYISFNSKITDNKLSLIRQELKKRSRCQER